jgi:peptidoglycan/xylan/chitin deacetylase (PgdA/CDA1 family)
MKAIMFHYVRPRSDSVLLHLNRFDINDFVNFLDSYSSDSFVTQSEYENQSFLTSNKILLTFDDGLKDHYSYVFPELNKRGILGVFFISTFPYLPEKRMLDIHKLHLLYGSIGWANLKDLFLAAGTISSADFLKISQFCPWENAYPFDEKSIAIFKYALNYFIPAELITDMLDSLVDKYIDINLRDNFYLNRGDIIKMKEGGMLFGGHGHSHTPFSKLSSGALLEELMVSKEILFELLGYSPNSMSYPYGDLSSISNESVACAVKIGYKFSFLAENFMKDGTDLMRLPRVDCKYLKI